MDASETILEQWIKRTAESYPRHAAALLTKGQDPFRNPVGHTMRRSLSHLLRELFAEMDATEITSAFDPIIRLQVVQGFAPDDALRFVSLLKPILREHAPEGNPAILEGRVDRLALLAVDKYTQCREQLARILANEVRRMDQVQQRIRAREPA